MVDNNDQTEQQKEERKNARSAARSKEQSDLSRRQEAEITQLLKARREEDAARDQAEQDRSDDRQKADAASEQEDQQAEQEAQRQLNELKGKFLQRATERANQVKEPGAQARAAAKYSRRALRLAEEADSFHRQIIGWRSGLAKKKYHLAINAENAFDLENFTFLKMMRGFEDEELGNKHTTEKALLVAKYNEEDRLDEKGDTGGDAEDSEDYKKEKEKIQHARDKVQKSIDERRDEVKKEHLLRLKGLKEQLKLSTKAVTEEYKKKLKAIYEARARKPSSRPYQVDRDSAQEGVAQQTYLEIVNQNETPDKPLSLARQNVEATHAYIKKLVGKTPWLERCGVGEVLSVNRGRHRCTVQLGSSPSYDTIENCTTTTVPVTTTHTVTTTQPVKDANGNVTGFENVDEEVTTTVNLQETVCIPDFTLNDQGHVILSDVRYGATHPKKGQSFTVHIPAVYRDAKTHYDAGRPWIIVPEQSTRFLYRKWRDETLMERWDWPPPPVDQPWLPEKVRDDLGKLDELVGAVTPDGEDTQIVIKHNIPSIEIVEGSHGLQTVGSYDGVVQYPGMGFDDGKEPWTPIPHSVRLVACANDSSTTVGYNWRDLYINDPGPITTGLDHLIPVSTETCCLPFPFTIIDPFTGNDITPQGPFCASNTIYGALLRTVAGEPTIGFAIDKTFGYKGQLEAFDTELGSYQNHFQQIHAPDETGEGVIGNVTCGGCHWFHVVYFVGWDACSPLITTFETKIIGQRATIYKDRFVPGVGMLSAGAWGDKAAYIIFDLNMVHITPQEWFGWDGKDRRLWLYGDFGIRDVTFPGFNGRTNSFDITAMAQFVDESGSPTLIMVGDFQDNDLGRQAYRWQDGGWSLMDGVDFVWDISQDGTDMLGSDKNGGQVYSLDSGKTWQPCAKLAPLPTRFPIFHSGAVKFIDDFS